MQQLKQTASRRAFLYLLCLLLYYNTRHIFVGKYNLSSIRVMRMGRFSGLFGYFSCIPSGQFLIQMWLIVCFWPIFRIMTPFVSHNAWPSFFIEHEGSHLEHVLSQAHVKHVAIKLCKKPALYSLSCSFYMMTFMRILKRVSTVQISLAVVISNAFFGLLRSHNEQSYYTRSSRRILTGVMASAGAS